MKKMRYTGLGLFACAWLGYFNFSYAAQSVAVKPSRILVVRLSDAPFSSGYLALGKIKRAIQRAEQEPIDAILLDIEQCIVGFPDDHVVLQEILRCKKPIYAFISGSATAFGALIALSCTKVYMGQTAIIGAAAHSNLTKEPALQSIWTAHMRNMAKIRHRDIDIIASMADIDYAIAGLKKPGTLLTLTATEALQYQICDAIVADKLQALHAAGYRNVQWIDLDNQSKLNTTETITYVCGLLIVTSASLLWLLNKYRDSYLTKKADVFLTKFLHEKYNREFFMQQYLDKYLDEHLDSALKKAKIDLCRAQSRYYQSNCIAQLQLPEATKPNNIQVKDQPRSYSAPPPSS